MTPLKLESETDIRYYSGSSTRFDSYKYPKRYNFLTKKVDYGNNQKDGTKTNRKELSTHVNIPGGTHTTSNVILHPHTIITFEIWVEVLGFYPFLSLRRVLMIRLFCPRQFSVFKIEC